MANGLKELTALLRKEFGNDSEAVVFNTLLEYSDLEIGSEVGYMVNTDNKIESFDFTVQEKEYSLPTLKKAIKKLEKLERKAGLIV